MVIKKQYLTRKEYQALKKKIQHLETVKRKEIAQALKLAASFGDLSENAAFDDAKNEQRMLERKIAELKDFLSQVKVIEKKEKKERIQIGSTVYIECKGKKMKFQIVGMIEANIKEGKISYESPIGKALLGKKKGEIIEIVTPAAIKLKYKILKIE